MVDKFKTKNHIKPTNLTLKAETPSSQTTKTIIIKKKVG